MSFLPSGVKETKPASLFTLALWRNFATIRVMFLFLKLYLAHLIADFILQFDELYRLKVKSRWGHIAHVLIHFAVSALLVFPYLKLASVWCFLAFITLIHYLQDTIKYEIQRAPQKMFTAFVIDQIVHAVILSGVVLLPMSRVVLGFPENPTLNSLYTDPFWTLAAIAWTLSTFGGSYLLYTFRQSYSHNPRPRHGITTPEMTLSLIERTVITFVFLFPSPTWLWFASPLIFIPRILTKKYADALDMVLSFLYAAAIGFLFKLWI